MSLGHLFLSILLFWEETPFILPRKENVTSLRERVQTLGSRKGGWEVLALVSGPGSDSVKWQ